MKPVIALLSTLIKEAILVAVLLWLLPLLGVRLPLGVIIGILITIAVWAMLTYRPIKRVMEKKALSPTEEKMAPKGLVRIEGETWEAVSSNADIAAGDEISVLQVDGLKLTVQKEK